MVPGEQWWCCLRAAGQLRSGLLAVSIPPRCGRVLPGVQPLQPAVQQHSRSFQLCLPPGLHTAAWHHL